MSNSPKEVVQKVQQVRGRADGARGRATASKATESLSVSNTEERGHIDGNDSLGNYSDGDKSYSYQMKDVSVNSAKAYRYDSKGNRTYAEVGDGSDADREVNLDKDPDGFAYADNKYKSISAGGVVTASGSTPAFSKLVSRDPGGRKIDALQGTIDNPNVRYAIKPETIFINNTPEVDDVRQRNIGDCYFLSAVLHIIQRDPQKLVNMMSVSGNKVTTKFFYRTGKWIHKWKEVDITTQIGELERTVTDNKEGKTETEVMGSDYRLEYNPSTSKWVANIEGIEDLSLLKITREDLYQAALWVISLEHAFEAYSQKYGRYGTGRDEKEELIEGISGGFEEKVFGVFYGKEAGKHEEMDTHLPKENQDILEANKSVIECLWKFQRSQKGDYKKDVFMSGFNDMDEAYKRYDVFKEKFSKRLNSSKADDKDKAIADFNQICDDIEQYRNKEIKQDALQGLVNPLTEKLYNYDAVQNMSSRVLTDFQDAVANIVQDGNNNLFLYSAHAYNISKVRLADSDNKLLNGSSFRKVFKEISAKKSKVTMQNPWGRSTANIKGSDKDGSGDYGKDYGTFTVPLDEFLRSVHGVSFAEIDHK